MSNIPTNRRHEAGVVSIMVTLIMMIVISLLVLGFAEVSRNEQRSSLDSQLSAQAYYAAESGINDARAAMMKTANGGKQVMPKPGCGNDLNYTLSGIVSAANGVTYTCVIITTDLPRLVYNIGLTSTVVPITSRGAAFGKLDLSWQAPSGTPTPISTSGCPANVTTPPTWPTATSTGQNGANSWGCVYPVVRVDLLDANRPMSRATWNADTATMFFVPTTGNSTPGNLADRGTTLAAQCTATSCTATIAGLGGTNYYMRITTLYRSNSLLTISSGNNTFYGAQATIDSTGKAQDVLRRVLVAVDLTDANAYKLPSGALITEDSVCKRFGTTNDSFNVYEDLTAGRNSNSKLCIAPTTIGTPSPP